ncbi:hypothetical protein N4R57_15450 [Rhodobacteraceae bacterium D3-12]|nr:hypothetical protein N4R57_15450 [Rhodobacteraceae bacterium D3-12]
MGQHVKESARDSDAIAEPIDETLSVVRQMMADEQSAAPKSKASKPLRAQEPAQEPALVRSNYGATHSNPPNKQQSHALRGLDALPPLDTPEPQKASKVRSFTRRKPAERHPLSSLESRFARLRARFVGLFPRRNKAIAADTRSPAQDVTAPSDGVGVSVDVSNLTLTQRALKAVREFRPTRKQIALFAFLVVMVWRPWLIPAVVFVLFWVGLIAYLTVGPDRIAEISAARWDWFQQRYPDRAANLRGKVQRGADRVDGWLARLPESWTDGIYLPDFGRSAAEGGTLDDQPDPFDRLAAEQKAVGGQAG